MRVVCQSKMGQSSCAYVAKSEGKQGGQRVQDSLSRPVKPTIHCLKMAALLENE